MFFNRVFLFFILFSSVGFFDIKYLSLSQIRLIQFITVGMMLAGILARFLYGTNTKRKKKFTLPIVIILTGVFLSSITAYVYHQQGFLITFWAQAPMYWFIAYFFLSVNNYQKQELEKALLFIAFLYSIFFIVQYLLYPTIYFDVRIDDDPFRGTLRIFLPGRAFLIAGYFIALNIFLRTNKLGYLLPLLLFFSVTLLEATRQFVFSLLLVTLYAIFFTKQVKSRGLIVLLLSISVFPLYFMFQDIIQGLIELSTSAGRGTDPSTNTREMALKFFLNDFFPSNSAYILGNGADHMRSPFGLKVDMLKHFGFYQSDIGLIGDYTKYGLIFVAGAVLSIIKLLKSKISPELNYIKYYALIIILLIPLSTFFTTTSAIFVLCVFFYLIDIDRKEYKTVEKS